MPKIISASTFSPPYMLTQETTLNFARNLFKNSFHNIERMLKVFQNGGIQTRYFCVPLEWFEEEHSLQERNDLYIECAQEFGRKAMIACLNDSPYLKQSVPYEEIEAIFFISSTGMSTPSIEARIMNHLPFSSNTKRIPIWGLGCAGGAAGLSRAYEYCLAFPKAKVLVLSVELCSLTFQRDDHSKSNLIGTSLFADGTGCALMVGDDVDTTDLSRSQTVLSIRTTMSTLMPNSEDVMGWDIKDNGLYVVFSKDIPHIIEHWLQPNVEAFLNQNGVCIEDIRHFLAHPGGRKVIEAYQSALGMDREETKISQHVLENYGNMSSATIFYVLDQFLQNNIPSGQLGLLAALGPGFSSEMLLTEWV
jgi:alkylresorcinol/alkylpyrone synthase